MSVDEPKDSASAAGKVVTLGADWPGEPLPVMPGDLSKYVPQGLGLGVPVVIRPWDDPLKALSTPGFYGMDALESDPIRAAPSQEPGGGVIYFDDWHDDEVMRSVLGALGVRRHGKNFAVFAGDAEDTQRERYLRQWRIVSKPALGHLFGAGEHAARLADQAVTVEEAVLEFLRDERARWTGWELSGTLGGDGDWAKESLAFGLLVENSYWGVYRVWSRPWLVTK
jgi:hypothetical protein